MEFLKSLQSCISQRFPHKVKKFFVIELYNFLVEATIFKVWKKWQEQRI